jgi:hypothetical protein
MLVHEIDVLWVPTLGKRMMYEKKKKMWENIWRCHRVGFLGQSRESWIYMYPTVIRWKICRIILRRPWRIGDRTVDSILLRGFGTYFIMICYTSLLSQDMGYRIGVRQGCNSWTIPCMLRSSGARLRRKEVSTGGWAKEKAWDTRDMGTLQGPMRWGRQTC